MNLIVIRIEWVCLALLLLAAALLRSTSAVTVSPISKSAGLAHFDAQQIWKPATQQTWKSALPQLQPTALFASAGAQPLRDSDLAQIRFEQKLNAQLSQRLTFRNESGQAVLLGDYFQDKPVILIMGYYQCPMLCNLVLNGAVESFQEITPTAGRDFEVVFVSIDPKESPALAGAKKRMYLKRYGRSDAANGWHFLTGSEAEIKTLAEQIGFRYAWDAASKQFAHPSGLVVLTPEGRVTRYLFGIVFPPRELRNALANARRQKISSPVKELILLCFHYHPLTGKYSAAILGAARVLSAGICLGLLAFVGRMIYREKRGGAAAPPDRAQ